MVKFSAFYAMVGSILMNFYGVNRGKLTTPPETRDRQIENAKLCKIIRNTGKVIKGEYNIKVIAKNMLGKEHDPVDEPVEISSGNGQGELEKADFPEWIFVIIVCIDIMGIIIIFLLNSPEGSEKDLLMEVSTELRASKNTVGEYAPGLDLDTSSPAEGLGMPEASLGITQTYTPSIEVQNNVEQDEGMLESDGKTVKYDLQERIPNLGLVSITIPLSYGEADRKQNLGTPPSPEKKAPSELEGISNVLSGKPQDEDLSPRGELDFEIVIRQTGNLRSPFMEGCAQVPSFEELGLEVTSQTQPSLATNQPNTSNERVTQES
jgi:hypothetical protein